MCGYLVAQSCPTLASSSSSFSCFFIFTRWETGLEKEKKLPVATHDEFVVELGIELLSSKFLPWTFRSNGLWATTPWKGPFLHVWNDRWCPLCRGFLGDFHGMAYAEFWCIESCNICWLIMTTPLKNRKITGGRTACPASRFKWL